MGFHLPLQQRGMFGPGIYFATDSDKSRYFSVTNQLLLCRVALGRALSLTAADESINRSTLQAKGYDSVQGVAGTKQLGGVRREEFVIYDPDQALPEYLIEFTSDSGACVPKFPFSKSFPTQLCTTCLASMLTLLVFAWSLDGRFAFMWHKWVRYYKVFWFLFFLVVVPVACVWYRASLSPMARRRGFLKLSCVCGTALVFAPLVAAVVCFIPVAHASLTSSAVRSFLEHSTQLSAVSVLIGNFSTSSLSEARFLCFPEGSNWLVDLDSVRQAAHFCVTPLLYEACPVAYSLARCSSKGEFRARAAVNVSKLCGLIQCPEVLASSMLDAATLFVDPQLSQISDFLVLLMQQQQFAVRYRSIGCQNFTYSSQNAYLRRGCGNLPFLIDLTKPPQYFQRMLVHLEEHRVTWLFFHIAVSSVCLVLTAIWLVLRRFHTKRFRYTRKPLPTLLPQATASYRMDMGSPLLGSLGSGTTIVCCNDLDLAEKSQG